MHDSLLRGHSRVRLGMLTPSSNTVLEPVTGAMIAKLPDVTAHFARFRVTQIGLSDDALGQFDRANILGAAELLADARVDAIAWNGTSAAWLGFGSDEDLCREITDRTGIPATTSVLAFRDAFRERGFGRIGLVTPYTGDVQARIQANWGAAGFDCTSERHLGLSENYAFAAVTPDEIARATRAVAAAKVDAVAFVCTNLAGAPLVPRLEAELGIPVLDSVAVTLWAMLRLAGRDAPELAPWGGPFAAPAREGRGAPARAASPPSQESSR